MRETNQHFLDAIAAANILLRQHGLPVIETEVVEHWNYSEIKMSLNYEYDNPPRKASIVPKVVE